MSASSSSIFCPSGLADRSLNHFSDSGEYLNSALLRGAGSPDDFFIFLFPQSGITRRQQSFANAANGASVIHARLR
jgi:hypothetical protein